MTVFYCSNQHSLDFKANYSYLYPKSQSTALLTDLSKLHRKSCKMMPDITCHANTGTFRKLQQPEEMQDQCIYFCASKYKGFFFSCSNELISG